MHSCVYGSVCMSIWCIIIINVHVLQNVMCVYLCMCVWMLKLLNVITAVTAVSVVIELYASPILLCALVCVHWVVNFNYTILSHNCSMV